jgi:hypothetical protein
MQRRAKERGTSVTVYAGRGEWSGWTLVKYNDEDKPSAFFMELTDHCACDD